MCRDDSMLTAWGRVMGAEFRLAQCEAEVIGSPPLRGRLLQAPSSERGIRGQGFKRVWKKEWVVHSESL